MYIIIYDFGTSSVKTCLFQIDSGIRIVASSSAAYGIYISENGGAEQDTEEWWEAICLTTRALLDHSGVTPDRIEGMAVGSGRDPRCDGVHRCVLEAGDERA